MTVQHVAIINKWDHVSLFSRTTSLKSRSRSFRRYPTRSPSSHLPTASWLLCLTISSTFLSSSVAMISPATLRQLGLAISSFIASILLNSFCRVSFILSRSPASFSSCPFMYSRMYFSLSRNPSSMMASTRSLRFLNSSLITLYMRWLKLSTLMFMPAISFRTLADRDYRQWVDSILADQKLAVCDTRPAQISLYGFAYSTPLPSRLSSGSSKLLNLLSWNALPTLLGLLFCCGANPLLGSSGPPKLYSTCCAGLFLKGSSNVSLLLVGVLLDSLLSLDLLLLFLDGFLLGELKREFFLRKVSRLSLLLMISLQSTRIAIILQGVVQK